MIFPSTVVWWKDKEQVFTTEEKVLAINEPLKQRLIAVFKLLPLVKETAALVAEVSTTIKLCWEFLSANEKARDGSPVFKNHDEETPPGSYV